MPEAATTTRVRSVPVPDAYRGLDGVDYADLAAALADHVTAAIDSFTVGAVKLAGMLVCPGFANEGPVDVPQGFMETAIGRVRAAGGLFIADEVQMGFGRTGRHWWSHQWSGVVPDPAPP